MTDPIIAELDKELAESGIEDISATLLGDDLESSSKELPAVPPHGTEKETSEKPSEPKAEEETPKPTERYSRHHDRVREEASERSKQRQKQDDAIKNLKSEMGEIKSLLQDIKNASSPQDKQEAKDKWEEFAERRGLDKDGIKEMVSLIREDIGKEKPEPKEEQNQVEEKSRNEKWEEHFNLEWETFSDSLEKEYPNATVAQSKEAKKVMDELAHSKEWRSYPLDYILFKNKERFDDVLFSPNKKSAEPSRIGTRRADQPEYDWDSDVTTPEEAERAEREIYKVAGNDSLPLYYNGEIVG